MTTVELIVTGALEKKALGKSLHRLFPDVEFRTQGPLNGLTSQRLSRSFPENLEASADQRTPRETNADKLARRLIAAVDPGRGGQPADFAVVVDDLELSNVDQPEVVIDCFRQAVERQLEHHFSTATRIGRTREKVRERCSFHLLCPMVESYFFAEHAVLQRAGAQRESRLAPHVVDLEEFETDDPAFLSPPEEIKAKWLKDGRHRHPKLYLQFLCDPEGLGARRYRETKGGADALEHLDWRCVMAPEESVRFARSLIHDLTDALEEAASPFAGACHELTCMGAGRGILRNL